MSRAPSPEETLRRATLGFLARESPLPAGLDEDMHPARLDPTERELERALGLFEEWKEKGMGKGGRAGAP